MNNYSCLRCVAVASSSLVLTFACTCSGVAQSPAAIVTAPQANQDASELDETVVRLKALIQATQDAKSQTADEPDPVHQSLSDQDELRDADDAAKTQLGLSEFESILQRVRALQSLKNKPTDSPIQPGHMIKAPQTGSKQSQQATSNLPATSPNAVPNGGPPSLAVAEEAMDAENSETPQSGEQDPEFSERMLKSPADPLRLAQSLYNTQNYASALKVLSGINRDEMNTSDNEWCEFLTAICTKRVGDAENAAAILRELSNKGKSKELINETKWWLSHYERFRTRKEDTESTLAQVDQLIEEASSYVRSAQ